ncbi:MAG: hypothetical protein ACI4KF_10510, partial [Huintestinicola sp.]
RKYDNILFFEEASVTGGIGEHLMTKLYSSGFRGQMKITGISGFVRQASTASILHRFKLDEEGMTTIISENMKKNPER